MTTPSHSSRSSSPSPPPSRSPSPVPEFIVKAPFDDFTLADLILRSSDGFDFCVSKVILAFASPIFRTMATLPTPPPSASDGDQDDIKFGLPIVVMHESKGPVLDAVLRFIYPDDKTPILDDVDVAIGVALTAMKYEMTRVMEIAEQELLRASMVGRGTLALRLCLEARRRGLKKIAHHFAIETLKCPLSDIIFTSDGLEETPALDLWQYFAFRKRVEEEISNLFQDRLDNRGRVFFDEVRKLYRCSRDCGNGPESSMSVAWTNWRACILENVHSAPLAIEVLSDSGLYRAKERTRPNCESCTSEIAEGIHQIVEAFKAEIHKVVLNIELN